MYSLASEDHGVKLFKYRWVVLAIFCLISFIGFFQMLQFTIIANVIKQYYGVDDLASDCTALISFLIYLIIFLPVSYHIEKYNLKIVILTCMTFIFAGNALKLLAISPDRFYVVILSQALCGVGQAYIISLPPKISAIWFGPNEISTASALAVLGNNLGLAVGSLISPWITEGKQDKTQELEDSLFNYLLYNAVASAIILGITAIFFRKKPKIPPSTSQLQHQEASQNVFLANFKTCLKNKDFIMVMIAFGTLNGIYNAMGLIVNQLYLNYFPGRDTDVGIIVLAANISGGCIGSLVCGLILDKTHQFKKLSFATIFFAAVSLVFTILCYQLKSRLGAMVMTPIFGFFAGSSLLICYEYVMEVTYPIPEAISCSIQIWIFYGLTIVITLLMEGLFSTIGYLFCVIVMCIVIFCCFVPIFFVSNELRRLKANSTQSINSNENKI